MQQLRKRWAFSRLRIGSSWRQLLVMVKMVGKLRISASFPFSTKPARRWDAEGLKGELVPSLRMLEVVVLVPFQGLIFPR